MTADEHVAATMFSWMIVSFHHHGWTEIYARFLHSQGWSYQQVYESLEQWLAKDAFFQAQINSIHSDVEAFYLRQQSTGYYSIWNTVQALFQDHQQSCQRLSQWFLGVYTGGLAWQVIELQQAFITDPSAQRRFVLTQPNNLLSVILELEPELAVGERTYEFRPTSQWTTLDEFMAFVVLRRKEGFGKNRITDVTAASKPQWGALECIS